MTLGKPLHVHCSSLWEGSSSQYNSFTQKIVLEGLFISDSWENCTFIVRSTGVPFFNPSFLDSVPVEYAASSTQSPIQCIMVARALLTHYPHQCSLFPCLGIAHHSTNKGSCMPEVP